MAEPRLPPGNGVLELLPSEAHGHESRLSRKGDVALWIPPESHTSQLGLQSPACCVMWAVHSISGLKEKGGSLARWFSGPFDSVVLDDFLELN